MKKNALMKRHFSLANSTKSFVRFFLASALAFNLSLFVSCSSDEDEPDDYKQTEETNRPYSVVIYESNKNLPSSGTLVSEFSDSPVNSDISKAVDGKLPTNFVTKADNFYILFNADYPVLLTQYSITCAANEPEKDPKSWELFGSNNSQTWTTIDSQSNQSFSYRNQEKIYKLASNTKEYKYYKLQIKSNNGGKGVKIAELNLTGESTNIDDLIKKYAEGYSGSSSTPMGNHYASKHETTDVDRTWLADPENEPDVPNHVSHLTWKEQVVNLYPFGEPLPADVNQHSIGDCSALAVFASMAYIYPEFVKSLIKDNKDKTYTVAMFDPQGKAVSVTVSSKFLVDNNGTLQAATGKYNAATWATVLEKAIIKWNAIYKVNTDIGGIGSEHVAPLFTGDGYSYAFYPGKLTAKEMARVVKVSLRNGMITVGGFNKGGLALEGGESVTGHAFTLMHSKNLVALFTMRNPWGGSTDGILNIPDNGIVQPTIDLRIINPGIASKYGSGISVPYDVPVFSAAENQVRVSPALMNRE